MSRNTCAGPGELRNLRLGNVDLENYSWIRVEERTKNDFRIRTLKCNDDACWALENLVRMARKKGAHLPKHFLLPHRAGSAGLAPDLTRPLYTFKKSWYAIRAEVAKKYPRLAKMRFYDERHTACTTMLGNSAVPYNAIEHYMGHQISSKTKRIYDHIRDESLQVASQALSSGHVERHVPEPLFEAVPANKATLPGNQCSGGIGEEPEI